MPNETLAGPEPTALRTALWRALHGELDAQPLVVEDRIGLELADPGPGWRDRPDMDPLRSARARASIAARARCIEDLVLDEVARGTSQYVLLGAGLDTFAQRNRNLSGRLRIFEIDPPAPQAWKIGRLAETGRSEPGWPSFVPFDFESGDSWIDAAVARGFDPALPSVVSWAGVCMYLTHEAIRRTLEQVASLARGTTLALTFMLPLDRIEPGERPGQEATRQFAALAGTPIRSDFAPAELASLVRAAGFSHVEHVASEALATRYFAGRSDALRPSSAEELLVARV